MNKLNKSYEWSLITLKLKELFERAFGLVLDEDDLFEIQESVEDSCYESCPNGIEQFLNIVLSGEEHVEVTPIPDRFSDFLEILFQIEDRFDLNICDYGEWILWHFPGLGYGLWIQREASPMFYLTEKRLLSISYQQMIDDY